MRGKDAWYDELNNISSLLDDVGGKKCCLGFLALTCGIEKQRILHVALPSDVVNPYEFPCSLVMENESGQLNETDLCNSIITVNDEADISEETRELELTNLFAMGGIEIKFEP